MEDGCLWLSRGGVGRKWYLSLILPGTCASVKISLGEGRKLARAAWATGALWRMDRARMYVRRRKGMVAIS